VPPGSRASQAETLYPGQLDETTLAKVRDLRDIARRRGQSMAQLALAWTQRDPRVTSTLVGASSLVQLEQNVATVDGLGFSDDELGEVEAVLSR
jgi:L-glyceraldehyde 3-phosphate reductase